MRYALYDGDRLLAYTELDIPCVQSHLRQGFLSPTDLGETVLTQATRVPATLAALRRARQRSATVDPQLHRDVDDAMARRDALKWVVRDERGCEFAFDFLRVYDLQDTSYDDAFDDDSYENSYDADDADLAEGIDALDLDSSLDCLNSEDWTESLRWTDDATWLDIDERWETARFLIQIIVGTPEWRERRR